MKRKQENYIPPCIKVIETKVEYHLLEGSNIGQGGHNSGTVNPPISGSKQGFFEEEEEEENEEETNGSWNI
jgi:hypothetical protein